MLKLKSLITFLLNVVIIKQGWIGGGYHIAWVIFRQGAQIQVVITLFNRFTHTSRDTQNSIPYGQIRRLKAIKSIITIIILKFWLKHNLERISGLS